MITPYVCYLAGALSAAIAVAVLWRSPRSFIHRILTVGMALFAAEAVCRGLVSQAVAYEDIVFWKKIEVFFSSFIPGIWLIFSLSFARSNYESFLSKWKWPLAAASTLGPLIVVLFRDDLFGSDPVYNTALNLFLRLEWAGYALYLFFLVSIVLILVNFERTFRSSTGHLRWQIKFMLLGIGGLFGVHLYMDSQAVLFRLVNLNLDVVSAVALIIACATISRSLARTKLLEFDFYLSHSVLYNSFTVLVVGVYFVAIGVIARLAYHFRIFADPTAIGFLVLLGILGLASLMLSDKLRYRRKRFISRNFKRPVYDYQKVWAGFTENTASLTSIRDLCLAVTSLVSHTCDVLSVSLWLVDDHQERLSLGHSTMLSESQAADVSMSGALGSEVTALMALRSVPVDLCSPGDEPAHNLYLAHQNEFDQMKIQYCVPLRASSELIAIMTLGKKVLKQPFSFEDYELLRTIADQAAASLLNLKLSEKLHQAKELEAFQVMSAFFMHDLKNLASKLSLVNQNMPVHFQNEEFRQDAGQTMSQCVDKIKGMCSRLSLLSQTLQLNRKEIDINGLIAGTMDRMNGQLTSTIVKNFGPVPLVMIDDEQMQSVFQNLLINANEAAGGNGQITVETSHSQGWVEVAVTDSGAGISREFREKYLFKPFQTTKKQGMGIGLFHCKTIVEAHGGRIEVESEEGKGSTFRILLPVNPRGQRPEARR